MDIYKVDIYIFMQFGVRETIFSTPGVLRLCSKHEIVTTVTAALCAADPHTALLLFTSVSCQQLARCYSPLAAATVLSLSTLSEVVSTRRSCAPPSTRTPPSPRPGTPPPPSCSSCRAREISDSSAVRLLSVSDKMVSNHVHK